MCLQDLSSILALALQCHSVFDISHFFLIVLDPFVPLSTMLIQNVSFSSVYDVFIYIFCQIFVDLVPFLLLLIGNKRLLSLQFVGSFFNADHFLVTYHSNPMSQR